MNRTLLVAIGLSLSGSLAAQTGTEFWMAPPDVSYAHNVPGDQPIYLNVTTGNAAATVTISQPANAGFNGGTPIVLSMAASTAVRYDLTALKTQLETRPTNSVLNTGLRIQSTANITVYYESSNTNNPDIMALKGPNGLGTEFYVPLHKYFPFHNHDFSAAFPNDLAYASFDIVATQNNTSVMIYSPVAVDGHPALTPFTIILNQGQTYSCANTVQATHTDPATHPSGAVVLSNKPIAISLKDDSDHNPSGGCYDLMLDQIVPVTILGTEYVAVKGQLNNNGDESVFVMAVENNTNVYVNGNAVPVTTLFAGQSYRIDMDYLSGSVNPNSIYITTSKPAYATHVTGFGCEMGMASLPPLNCAGSQQVSFTRSTNEAFYLNLLVRNGSQNNFVVTPATATIPGAAFVPVPGTGGQWLAAQIQYTLAQVPVTQAFIVTNTTDVFSLGLINGGAVSGCRYGFFSEFAGQIVVNAGPDQARCVSDLVNLTGSVSGGTTTGIWTSTGSGTFTPNATTLNATYVPSLGDQALGSVTLTLTSTGNCTPKNDAMTVTFQQMPVANGGADRSICSNNPAIALSGTIQNAVGGLWGGGAGTFSPSTSSLNATYTPTAAEIASGSMTITLTTNGNGVCPAVVDNVAVTFTPSPTANAGPDQTRCANNAVATLTGSVTVGTGGIWSGGAGTFAPSTTNLNATYTPTAAEIASGSVILTLTTTGNGNCNAVSDQITINYTPAPTVNAGPDVSVCVNNSAVALNGSVTVATGGQWSGGTGTFTPNNTTLNAVYAPTAAEMAAGTLTLTLTTTGNGNCTAVNDSKVITFTPAPIVNAGADGSVCANAPTITLAGSVVGATGGIWSGGAGTFAPNNTTLNATYVPTAAERSAGSVTLTLTSAGNGNCSPVTDQVTWTITPSPTVNAGADQTLCGNNATAALNASITVATGVQWSGGAGAYSPGSTALNITYAPTAAEVAVGSLTLTATTTGNGTCTAVADQVVLTFTNAPIANAGADASVCANNPAVTLNGSIAVATGGQWSGGTGSFSPNSTTLNAVYTPTTTEIAGGSLTLTLTTTGNGTCNPVSDAMIISFTPAPTVNAGVDGTVCASAPTMALAGAVTGASGGIWSGGTGAFTPNNTTLNATYTPTAAEIAAGSVTLTLTSAGNGNCLSVSDQVTWMITPSPTVNAGADQTLCGNNATATLNAIITVATGVQWSGGTGTYSPGSTALNITYSPSAIEIANGSVTLNATTTGNGSCLAAADQVTLTFTAAPTANAGADVSICANNPAIALNGVVTVATGGQWTGGTGSYTPGSNSLSTTYTPTAAEIAAGTMTLTLTTTGNGSCNAATDDKVITFTPAPIVNAGADGTVCASAANMTLAGSVTGATGGIWSGGTGTFAPNNTTLNATYTPTAAEIVSGSVTLTLTSAGNGTCNPVSDQVTWTITPSPTVNAGADQTLCGNNSTATINALITVATGVQWSGGAGTYSPGNTALNITYAPSPIEIANGSVTLTATTTGNGTCLAASDQITLTFTPAPTANAGPDASVCVNNPTIALNGSVTVATGGQWTGGLGLFSPGATALNATYTPTAGEIAAGTLTLTLTTTGNGTCSSTSDAVTITFTPAPTVNAGADGTVCANTSAISLNGSIIGATGGIWSGGTGTYAPNSATLNATYTPSVTEIAAGTVTLTLTSAGNGNCNAVSDQVTWTITPAPTVNVGPDRTLCANNASVNLNATITVATGVQWTGGTGTYAPSNTAVSITYTPSAAEIALGSVTLTATTTGNGTCLASSDQVVLTFTNAPTANAGADASVCVNNAAITLNGSVTVASGGQWSGGLGSFAPGSTALNAVYTPTAAELAGGSLTLTLTTTGNGTCSPASDQVTINFTPAPTVNAGADGTVCSSTPNIALNGSITGATGGIWSGGAGTFAPNNTTLNATYSPTAAEIAAGMVTLTLTSAGNGNCNPVTDQVIWTITPSPTVNAGADQTHCGNNAAAILNATMTVASGVQWSGGTGVYSPGSTAQNITYSPSPAEIAAGSVTLTVTTTGNGSCVAASDQVTIIYTLPPTANAGPDVSVSSNNADVTLSGSVTVAMGGQWSGGLGTFNPGPTALNAVYSPTAAEIAAGSMTLTLTTTGNGTCAAVSDQMTITFTAAPTANAGPDQSVCANNATAQLNGSVTIATGGIWSGGGTFTPNSATLNATYTLSAAEIAAGSVTLTLTTVGNGNSNPVSDQMTITVTPSPVSNAGPNIAVCANQSNAQLVGAVSNATGGIWSGGSGSFNPSTTNLNAIYSPTLAEIAAGSVTLTLTTTGNGTCNAVSDQVLITIAPAPVVDAGPVQTACANNPNVTLAGSVSGATGGIWSGGTGVFTPSVTALNAVYTPSSSEIISGSVTLTLNSTGNGSCAPVSDQVLLVFSQSPVVNAGADVTVCENAPNVTLNGSVTVAGGGAWSGGGGSFNPNANTLNATYTPSPAEIALGTVTLTLTSTGNGNCNPVSDAMTITILDAPIADAGNPLFVCSNNAQVQLGGSVSGAGGGQWSGGAGTFSPSIAALNAIYTPTAAEIAAGSLTLTLTTIGNGFCQPVTDQVLITFTPAPTAEAGTGSMLCANNASIALAGSVTVASGGAWSGVQGSFSPNANALNATYTPSAGEIAFGSVTLTLTTTGNNGCNAVSDQVTYTFSPAPTANAGPNAASCANNASVALNGAVTIATGGIWTGGGGSYAPNSATLNATYTPSAAEISAGSATLTLTTIGNGSCNPVSDQMTITIGPSPVVDAGTPLQSCANNPNAQLAGSVQNATGGAWSGAGTFSPSNTNLNAIYTPTAAEIAAGTATVTLTSTGNGLCNAVSDPVTITIIPSPIANAGPDQTRCANNAGIQLAGGVTNAAGGTWSGGLGSYSPNSSTLSATYTPTPAEVAAGSVTLTLTTTGNNGCLPVSDQVTITFSAAPTANAGPDALSCSNNPAVSLAGSVTVATGGIWSGGTGTYAPNSATLNATYTPSAAEITAGTATLTLTTVGNGSCNAVSDQVTITIGPSPVVDAGAPLQSCANNASAQLNGSVLNAAGGAWTGAGSFAPGNTALNATYTPTAAEIAAGTATVTLTSTGNGLCNAVSDQVTITITPAPVAIAGADQTVCANNASIQLAGSVSNASGGTWSGAQGTFSPSANALNATYVPSASEIAAGFVTLTLTTTGNNGCNAVSDPVTYSFSTSPTANAGPDASSCGNNAAVTLAGSVTVSTGGIWSGGAGSFNPSNTALNVIYTPNAAEIAAGTLTLTLTTTGNGNCNAASDAMIISIAPSPIVDAGNPLQSCANAPTVQLAGSVQNAIGGIWSGAGTFSPSSNSLNATYTPTAAEIVSGTATVTLTSTGNGLCNPVSDPVTITIHPAPVVNAGSDQTLCANNANIQLAGAIANASGGVWSGAQGSFNPSANALNALYSPSQGEIVAGSVTLTLTSTGNGLCAPVSDQVTFTFTPAPTASAGPDAASCANNASVALNGAVTVATGGIWTGGSGSYSPNNGTLNATYTPSAAEIATGSATLTLTTVGNGSCNAVSDAMSISIAPAPVVDAGSPLQSCANNATVQLAGSVQNAAGGAWSGAGTFSPSNTNLNATYTPTATEIAAGTATVTLTSTGNGLCNAVNDAVTITIHPAPAVNAGADQILCANNATIQLAGSVSNAGGGTWSGAQGSFSPNANALNATYTPSLGEIAAGSLTLTLTSTGNGLCNAVERPGHLHLHHRADGQRRLLDAASCREQRERIAQRLRHHRTGGIWSGGTGSFNPNSGTLNATYTPSARRSPRVRRPSRSPRWAMANCSAGERCDDRSPSRPPRSWMRVHRCSHARTIATVQLPAALQNAGGGVWPAMERSRRTTPI
jgi:hypothetical protein